MLKVSPTPDALMENATAYNETILDLSHPNLYSAVTFRVFLKTVDRPKSLIDWYDNHWEYKNVHLQYNIIWTSADKLHKMFHS